MRWLVMLMVAVTSPAFAAQAATAGVHRSSTDPQRAEVDGRTVTDVTVEIAGVPARDAAVLELVETRVGEPLVMHDVRATIDHLIGLGRFEDVRVFASPTDQGVALRWQLLPVKRITKITVAGRTVLPASAVRAELADRFGTLPSANRVDEMVTRLQAFYAARGFLRATILPRIQDEDPAPERAELVLTIDAGDRITIGSATVTGRPLEPAEQVLRTLDLETGRPFDQTAIDARLAAYEESLRDRGYYEARVRESHVGMGDQQTVALSLAVDPGPHVSLVFEGDPLPGGNRDGLVPIREERSVDQDLLEDASGAIVNALRERGYRNAQAQYRREEKGGELVVTFTVARGPLHRIASVEAAGHARITAVDLAPLLQIEAGDPFVEARVGLVSAAITELYRVRGFAQAVVKPDVQVLPPETSADVTFRPVSVRFQIAEGPQTIVSGVDFEGSSLIPADMLRAQMVLQPGKPFYRPQLAVDRDALERAYRNQGFQGVSVISQLAFATAQQLVALTWIIREGEQIKVDRVLINGNARVSTELVRRELTLRPGSPMSDDAMIESQRRLAALGLFRRVRISELPRTGSLTRDVLVDLEETEPTTVDYGGGFEVGRIGASSDEGAIDELDFGPRGFIGISRRNLWGKNRSVTLFGRVTLRRDREEPADPTERRGYGFHDYRGLFTFREPRAFGTTGDAQFTAFVEQARRTSFSFKRRGVTSDYARRFAAFTATGRYTFDHTSLFEDRILAEDQLPIDRLFPQVRLSKLFGAIVRDSRDDVLDPQRGAVLGFDASVAAKAYGSEIGFMKTFMQGFIYRRLPGRGVVVAAGARLGVAVGFPQEVPPPSEIAHLRQGFGGQAGEQAGGPALATLTRAVDRADLFPTVIRDLPASERFFAGGDTTVRGFALDRLGTVDTLDSQGFPQGGNGLAIFNLETRAPYWKNLQFVWFLDAGNVFDRASHIRLDELRFSSGLGVRYRSPIGPLRVDWGWKLTTRLLLEGGRERSNVWHVSLGQAF
jgi:outer membrane protein insertion porin family